MKNLFEQDAVQDIITRIEKLSPGNRAVWGKMNVSQMMAHCQAPLEVALGDRTLKRSLAGILFGRMAKRKMVNEAPFQRNLPTDTSFRIKDERDFEMEKARLIELVKRFGNSDAEAVARQVHPFFGKMTAKEWGLLSWKHLDHHLNQFGV